MSTVNWTETKNIISELEKIFAKQDDIRDILDINKMGKEIQLHCSDNIQEAKEIIKHLASRVASKESEIIPPSEAEHAKMVDGLTNEHNDLLLEIDNLRHLIEEKNENILKLKARNAEMIQAEAETPTTPVIPQQDSRTAYALSLYSKITNISWDYSSPSGRLSGYIGSDKSQKVTSFSLDTRSLTSFKLANELWSLIEEAADLEDE